MAVESIEGLLVDGSDIDVAMGTAPALSLLLKDLSFHNKQVVVHLATRQWRGTFCEVGADWCDVVTGTGALITIPVDRVLWLSVGADLGDGDN